VSGYDVIVVGARVAGASTAMLLARQGARVLLIDRARFPSDTVSSHQVQVPGIARLNRWGLLGQLRAAGTPPTRRVRFDTGPVVLDGHFPACQGVDTLYSPRRTVLDALLVDAARAAGAEVRERFRAEELTWSGGRVTGIRGSGPGAAPVTETARLVVGADGKHSLVASAVAATRYHQRPVLSFACYSYWSGLPVAGGEIYQRPGRAVAVFPTNGGLVMVYMAAPLAEFGMFRSDIEGNYLAALDSCGDLGERARGGVRAERLRTTPDQPNAFRASHGPGWALVGDAGVVMDSISAQALPTPCGMPTCSPKPSPPAWAGHARSPPRSPTTSGVAMRQPGRCTTSRSGWPASPRRAWPSAGCSHRWPAARPRPTGSSAPSPESSRSRSTSRPGTCCVSSASAG
jgi:2-polyprenyl-6-methoxyphenol hydroxylase-like FAD-dependent oxidoreductase